MQHVQEWSEIEVELILTDEISSSNFNAARVQFVGGLCIRGLDDDVAICTLIVNTMDGNEMLNETELFELELPVVENFEHFRILENIIEYIESVRQNLDFNLLFIYEPLNPRGLNLARHIGLRLNLPTISCFHSVQNLTNRNDITSRTTLDLSQVGDSFEVENDAGDVIGLALRSHHASGGIIYINTGYEIDLEDAQEMILSFKSHSIPPVLMNARQESRRQFILEQLKNANKKNIALRRTVPTTNFSDSRFSVETALCVIPPEEYWKPIQKIREKHDNAFGRWMPHINLFFPFMQKVGNNLEAFTEEVLKPICAGFNPFKIELNHLECFKRKRDAQLFVSPNNKQQLIKLQNLLRSHLPEAIVNGNRPDFEPHLSLGQFKKSKIDEVIQKTQSSWKPIPWNVDRIFVITRTGNVPFQIEHEIFLGKGPQIMDNPKGFQRVRFVQMHNDSTEEQVFKNMTSIFEVALQIGVDPEENAIMVLEKGESIRLNIEETIGEIATRLNIQKGETLEMIVGLGNQDDSTFQCRAKLVTCGTTNLPLAKLTLVGQCPMEEVERSQKTIIFCIDVSGSMSGGRMNNVEAALCPFMAECWSQNDVELKLITYTRSAQEVALRTGSAGQLDINHLKAALRPGGGTRFDAAAQQLCATCRKLIREQKEAGMDLGSIADSIRIVFISDGETSRQDSDASHSKWKRFIETNLAGNGPYIDCIGIGNSHSADILDGFIVNDNGNYAKCTNSSQEVKTALEKASMNVLNRRQANFDVESPVLICPFVDTDLNLENQRFKNKRIIISEELFNLEYWVPIDKVERLMKQGLHVDKKSIAIDDGGCLEGLQGLALGLEYFREQLRGMLSALRDCGDNQHKMKQMAKRFQAIVQQNKPVLDELRSDPIMVREARKKVQLLLPSPHVSREEKAEALRDLKSISNAAKSHKAAVAKYAEVNAEFSTLMRMILVDNARMESIRQHVVNLHFKGRAAKRAAKLAMDDSQLEQRDQFIKSMKEKNALTESMVEDITDDIGSGCFLSCLSKREIALDSDILWICGRVNREHGMAVANPELLRIEYISPDLVSGEYFELAMQTKENADGNDAGFFDGSREMINARLFPLFGNHHHYRCAWPDIQRVLGHTISGRYDIKISSFGSLFAVLGQLIQYNDHTERNLEHILHEIVPSFNYILDGTSSYLYEGTTSQIDVSGQKLKLRDLSMQRLESYMNTPECRGPWWGEIGTILSDALLQVGKTKTKITAENFWLPLIVHCMRKVVKATFPFSGEDREGVLETEKNHLELLHCLVFGTDHQMDLHDQVDHNLSSIDFDDSENEDNMLNKSAKKVAKKAKFGLFDVPKWKTANPHHLQICEDRTSKYQVELCYEVLGRLHWKALAQACNLIMKMQAGETEIEELKIDRNTNLNAEFFFSLLEEVGELSGLQIRAMVTAALLAPNKTWRNNCANLSESWNRPIDILELGKKKVFPEREKEFSEMKRLEKLKKKQAKHRGLPTLDKYGDLPFGICPWCKNQFTTGLVSHFQDMLCYDTVKFCKETRSRLVSDPGVSYEEYEIWAGNNSLVDSEYYWDLYERLRKTLWKYKSDGTGYELADGIFDDNEDLKLGRKYRFEATGKSPISVCMAGHFDSGKSTLSGQLLYQLGGMSHREFQKLQQEAIKAGDVSKVFAFFLDKTKEERLQGKTMDYKVAQFFTANHHYTLVDGPGHEKYIKNAIRGQSQADVAIIVVPAIPGGFEDAIRKPKWSASIPEGQCRAHIRLLSTMGVKHYILAINKMDDPNVNYSEDRFEEIKAEVLRLMGKVGIKKKSVISIPISGWTGDNVFRPSDKMPWYTGFTVKKKTRYLAKEGHTLYDALNIQNIDRSKELDKPFRLMVTKTYQIKGVGFVACGSVLQGSITASTEVRISPQDCGGRVGSIETHHKSLAHARAGHLIGLAIRGLHKSMQESVRTGSVVYVGNGRDVRPAESFRAAVFVQDYKANQLKPGFCTSIYCAGGKGVCLMVRILWKKGPSSNNIKENNPSYVAAGDEAEIIWAPRTDFIVSDTIPKLKRLIICNGTIMSMLGRVLEVTYK